ncbi:MAG: DUF2778 domain-containing protein [Methylovirgula sp.]
MTYEASTPDDFIPLERVRLSRKPISRTVSGAFALAVSLVLGGWILYIRCATGPNVEEAHAVRPAVARVVARAVLAPVLTPLRQSRRTITSNPYGALFDATFSLGLTPVPFAQSSPLGSNFEAIPQASSAAGAEAEKVLPTPEVSELDQDAPLPTPRPSGFGLAEVESVPLPMPRPAELGLPASHSGVRAYARQLAQQNRTTVLPATSSDHRTFFEKLFGKPQPSGPVLAYAAPEDGVLGNARRITSGPMPPHDQRTAVYNIAAHTVYMPDGTRLEAHSGLGDRMDDPRHVSERMRGPTPPNVYELEPREQLFHGVQALRLIPVGSGGVYGRTGLLAHSYMLGPYGASNGCVSFKNYNAFLQAFLHGEVKHLVVVAGLN